MDIPAFERVVQLALQFGPFLFAILFILVVTRTAYGYYNDCITRTAPPASAEERKTYRFYFLCSVWAGIAVMALSIDWWVYAQSRGNNVYQVAIVNLKSDEYISADYFTKSVQRPVVRGGSPIHDDYLLVVQDKPFQIGDKFTFSYYKVAGVPGSGLVGVDPVELGVPTRVTAADENDSRPQILMGEVTQGPPSLSRRAGDR
jgi:hypothetical protein